MKNNDVTIINLDRPRELRYTYKSFKTMDAMMKEIDKETFDGLEVMLYCGLLHDAKQHNEKLELSQMEDLLDEAESLEYINAKLEEAMSKATGEGKNPLAVAPRKARK